MTRHQKIRQQKVLHRADIVKDQMELKVRKSAGKLQKTKERSKTWDNVNEGAAVGDKGHSATLGRPLENDHDVHMATKDDGDHPESNLVDSTQDNVAMEIPMQPLPVGDSAVHSEMHQVQDDIE